MQEIHFKTTEPGATAHICTDKTYAVTDRKARRERIPGPENGRKGGVEAKKEKLYIYIWIIVVIFAYK